MAEKQPPSPGTGSKPPVNKTGAKNSSAELDPSNIIPITLDKLTAEQRDEIEQMMSNVKDQLMNSFQETRRGTIVQKYKLLVVAADEAGSSSSQGDKGAATGSGDKGDVPCHARKLTSNFRTYLCIKPSSRNQPRYTN